MQLQFDDPSFARAKTPEEFAQVFKEAATKALASAIVEAVSTAISSVESDKAVVENNAITGWQEYITGIDCDVCWAKPALSLLPLSAANAFAAYSPVNLDAKAFGGSWGCSIGGTF